MAGIFEATPSSTIFTFTYPPIPVQTARTPGSGGPSRQIVPSKPVRVTQLGNPLQHALIAAVINSAKNPRKRPAADDWESSFRAGPKMKFSRPPKRGIAREGAIADMGRDGEPDTPVSAAWLKIKLRAKAVKKLMPRVRRRRHH